MSIADLSKLIGASALLRTEGLQVTVMVKDVRIVFGRVDLLVVPVNGNGQAWVSRERVTIQ